MFSKVFYAKSSRGLSWTLIDIEPMFELEMALSTIFGFLMSLPLDID